jgi:hypothetical protein
MTNLKNTLGLRNNIYQIRKKKGAALEKVRVLNLNTTKKLKQLLFAVHCQRLMNLN